MDCKEIQKIFCNACRDGDLNSVKELTRRHNLTIVAKSFGYEALIRACEKGHIKIAEWLTNEFQLTINDVRSNNNYILTLTCWWGRFETAQWLVKKFCFTVDDIRISNDIVLLWVCIGNHKKIAEWLLNDYYEVETALQLSKNSTFSSNMRKWLKTLFESDVRFFDIR